MKSIFRTIALLAVLSCALSCTFDSLYVQLPDTNWTIESDSQRAFVHFTDDRASVLQRNCASGAVQILNGDYIVDGHKAVIDGDNGSTLDFVRTFSHLKNSSNKNFSTFHPESVQSLDHTVWVTLEQENFHLLYFMPNGSVKTADYKNIVREEGIPYGWENTKMPFSLAGNQVGWGENSGTLFPEVMLVNDVWYMHFPVNEDQGESSLYGTLWTYKSSGYPGILVFDTNSSFTRILLSSVILLQVSRGTYSLDGNVLTMKLDGKQEECTLGADSFTFFERTYEYFE